MGTSDITLLQKNIKFIRKRSELTQQGFADKIGVNRPVVGAYEEGRAEPKIATLQIISEAFKIPLELLINRDLSDMPDEQLKNYGVDVSGNRLRVLSITVDQDDKENIEFVPVKASAGYTNGFSDPEYMQELPRLYVPTLGTGTYRAFEIKGDSMLPIQTGTVIVGQYVDNWHDVKTGGTYVVVTLNEGVVYKRVVNRIYDSGDLELISDNKAYTQYSVPVEDILEIWEAKMYLSTTFPDPEETKEDDKLNMNQMTDLLLSLQKEVNNLKGK